MIIRPSLPEEYRALADLVVEEGERNGIKCFLDLDALDPVFPALITGMPGLDWDEMLEAARDAHVEGEDFSTQEILAERKVYTVEDLHRWFREVSNEESGFISGGVFLVDIYEEIGEIDPVVEVLNPGVKQRVFLQDYARAERILAKSFLLINGYLPVVKRRGVLLHEYAHSHHPASTDSGVFEGSGGMDYLDEIVPITFAIDAAMEFLTDLRSYFLNPDPKTHFLGYIPRDLAVHLESSLTGRYDANTQMAEILEELRDNLTSDPELRGTVRDHYNKMVNPFGSLSDDLPLEGDFGVLNTLGIERTFPIFLTFLDETIEFERAKVCYFRYLA